MKMRLVAVVVLLMALLTMALVPVAAKMERPSGLSVLYGLHALARQAELMDAPNPQIDAGHSESSAITWQNRADAPEGRATGTLTYVRDTAGNHNLWYMGGIINLDGDVSGAVHKLNAPADVWTANVSTMPFPAGGHCAVALGQTIFAIGGTDSAQTNIGVQAYDTAANTWNTTYDALPAASYPNGVAAHGCAALGNVIYVFGGGDPVNFVPYNQTYTFNPMAPPGSQWALLAFTMNHGRAGFGYVADPANNRIYTAGGSDAYPNNLPNEVTTVEYFTPGVGWTTMTPLSTARTGASLHHYRNQALLIAGGGVLSPRINTSACILPACSSWMDAGNMNNERAGQGYTTIQGLMFVAGGLEVNFIIPNFIEGVELGR